MQCMSLPARKEKQLNKMDSFPKKFKIDSFVQRFENFLKVTKIKTKINNEGVHTPKPKLNIVLNVAQIIKYGQSLAKFGDENKIKG